MLVTRQPVPPLSVETVAHGPFDITQAAPARFTLVVFYRGLHCAKCAAHLTELERLCPAFEDRGVEPIAVSVDGEDRAQQMADKVKANGLRVGYDLSLAVARAWGLGISASRGATSIGIEESALFCEPGVFLVGADGNLFFAITQTMPFVRPHFADMLPALDFIIEKGYPARGEYDGPV